jgi:hypothetical protein
LLLHSVVRPLAADNCEIVITTKNVGPAMKAARGSATRVGPPPAQERAGSRKRKLTTESPFHALMSVSRCRFEALGHSPRLDGSSAAKDASIECNTPQRRKEEIMRIRFVAKDPDSVPDQSPTLYKTDRDSWLVQGWVVTDPATLAEMNIPEGETVVEIPGRLVPFFREG